MTRLTLLFGAILILLGLGAYAYAMTGEKASVTALIPAFFGVPILAMGLAAGRWPARRSVFMHVAVVLAVLGLFGAARGLTSLPALITRSEEVARPAAVVVQSVMAVLCLVYVIMGIRSFIVARRS